MTVPKLNYAPEAPGPRNLSAGLIPFDMLEQR